MCFSALAVRSRLSSSLAASIWSTRVCEGCFLCLAFRAVNLFSRFLISISLSFLGWVTILIILPLIVALWAAQSTSGEVSSTLVRRKYSFRELSISEDLMVSLRMDSLSHQCVPNVLVRELSRVMRTKEWSDQAVSTMVALWVDGIRSGCMRI